MAIRLTTDLLVDLGYSSLTERQAEQLLRALYDAGETIVGMTLANRMTDNQLDQFERFMENSDDDSARAWLELNFPDYQEVVIKTFESLQDDLRLLAREIVSAKADPKLPTNDAGNA